MILNLVKNLSKVVNKAHMYDKLMKAEEPFSAKQTRQILVKYSRTIVATLISPLNHPSHFSTLARVISAHLAHATMRMVSSPYHKHFSSYVGHHTSYICFWDFPLSWWPMVNCGLLSMKVQSLVDHRVAGAPLQQPWQSWVSFPCYCCSRALSQGVVPRQRPTQIAISSSSHLRLRWAF